MEKTKLDWIINIIREHMMFEDVPTNNVGSGNIAGTPEADPENPPVFKKKKKNIYLGIGSRKRWMKTK